MVILVGGKDEKKNKKKKTKNYSPKANLTVCSRTPVSFGKHKILTKNFHIPPVACKAHILRHWHNLKSVNFIDILQYIFHKDLSMLNS